MDLLRRIRAAFDSLKDLWDDRDIHIPALKEGLKALPERFRSAESTQRRNLLIAIGVLVVIQLLFLTTL